VHLEKLCYDAVPPYTIYTRHGYIIEFRGGENDKTKARGFHISFKFVPEQMSERIGNDVSGGRLNSEAFQDLSFSSSSSAGNDALASQIRPSEFLLHFFVFILFTLCLRV
ncbi:unnamed protein product, partial [Gongylonema pulchrum]|uniref:IRS-type PTB domain-containing protein n=1 Tax=Gongylonema pulchrum TaxID=637853 RepID=A0A183DB53_9BILA